MSPKSSTVIVWHRRDLRIDDNHALYAASRDADTVIPLFVFDDAVLEHGAAPRVYFMLDALTQLQSEYRFHNSDLVVSRGPSDEEVVRIARDYEADAVYWNRDYSGLARERDQGVKDALDSEDISHSTYKDAVLHGPDEIYTNEGEPYSVYTYYHKKWVEREKEDPFPEPESEYLGDFDATVPEARTELPTINDLGFSTPSYDPPIASTEEARTLLEDFCSSDIYSYAEDRDYPALESTSRLSPHLKFGTIGIREVWKVTEEAKEDADTEEEKESVEEFQSQLAWREFYNQVLYHNPSVVSENYKDYENPIDWRDDEEELDAWKNGETGYPIVDAGMRQLSQTGYMHNRLRMIVASFLTKDLLFDWREGYAWFRRKLVDHDTANDNGGWQWAASTGTDAQPYFRVFNPMTQGERYDPDAEYIKKYVSELSDVDPNDIHSWHELSDEEREELAPEYVHPVVDHSERREKALEMFENARGENHD